MVKNSADDGHALRRVKLLHTIAWLFFVGCILGIYVAAYVRAWRWAAACIVIVAVEVAILAFNAWRCPLTAVAARYTTDRAPNFDIYLPRWIAQYNKEIFGPLYVIAIVFAMHRWMYASVPPG